MSNSCRRQSRRRSYTDYRFSRKRIFADESEAEIARRLASSAAAGPRVTNKVRHVRPVTPLDDTDAAIGNRRLRASHIRCVANETGIGPLPDVSGEIEYAILVSAEAADRPRCSVKGVLTIGLKLVLPKPALGLLDRTIGKSVVGKTSAGGEGPLLVGG